MGLLLAGRACEVYIGVSVADKANYILLKVATGQCLDPCDSDDWNSANVFF